MFEFFAQTTQPTKWTAGEWVILLTCIAGVLIPALILLVNAIFKGLREVRALATEAKTTAARVEGQSNAQDKTLDRLAETNRTQATQIADLNRAIEPEKK